MVSEDGGVDGHSMHYSARVAAGLALLATLAISACSAAAILTPAPTPQLCDAVYPMARCELIVDAVAAEARVPREEIASISIVPEPMSEVLADGTKILQTRSGGPLLIVDALLADGSTWRSTMCAGIAGGPVCMDDPFLRAETVTGGGYRDLPCPGEPPDGCATAHPPPDPGSVATARPIRIAAVDVPIDHVGAYEVPIGEGSLPNGILTEASFALGDDWPDGVTIPSGSVRMEVRSLEPDGRSFWNYYDHGWRAGVERVEAVLVFEVARFDAGGVLAIRDVIVR